MPGFRVLHFQGWSQPAGWQLGLLPPGRTAENSTVETSEYTGNKISVNSSRQYLLLLCDIFELDWFRAQQGTGEHVSEQYVLLGC